MANPTKFKSPSNFSRSEIKRLVELYLKDTKGMVREVAALKAGNEIVEGDLTATNLMTIVTWKSQRAKGWVESNSEADVKDTLQLATEAKSDRAAISVLLGLRGVAIPMASAILTAIRPKSFTIIDVLALKSLGVLHRPGMSVDFYLGYLTFCREAASSYGVELRDFDHALWQHGKMHDAARRAA
jgi:hypothetical protein